MQESSGLQPIRSQRVGHDYARKNGLFLFCLFEQGMVTILGKPAENGD